MAAARFYSSTSGLMELQADISAASTTMSVDSTTGLPGTTPFTLVIEPGVTGSEEIVTVTNVGGTTLTITRGVDGTSATAHSAGSEIRHMATARDFREPQEHIGASANVHGVGSGSSVVGTDTEQTLTNKTLVAADADTEGLVVKGASSQSANIFEVQDSAGNSLVAVDKDGTAVATGDVQVKEGAEAVFVAGGASTRAAYGASVRVKQRAADKPALSVQFNDNNSAPLLSVENTGGDADLTNAEVASFAWKSSTDDVELRVGGSPSSKSLQVVKNGTGVASIDKDGKLTAAAVTSSGDVSGTTGTFSGEVAGSNIPSTIAATSATKNKKRMHWGFKSGQTLTGAGDATFTHGAGFTPESVVIVPTTVGLSWSVDNITSTTFGVHFRLAAGGSYTTPVSFSWFCGE